MPHALWRSAVSRTPSSPWRPPRRPPIELCGQADLVTIVLPWGSLLRGALGRDDAVMAGIAALVAPGGQVEVLIAPSARDGIEWPADPSTIADVIVDPWARHGLRLLVAEATADGETRRDPSFGHSERQYEKRGRTVPGSASRGSSFTRGERSMTKRADTGLGQSLAVRWFAEGEPRPERFGVTADLKDLSSTWAKRLRLGTAAADGRRAWRLVLAKVGDGR